jgi:hypothetical protein
MPKPIATIGCHSSRLFNASFTFPLFLTATFISNIHAQSSLAAAPKPAAADSTVVLSAFEVVADPGDPSS